MPLDQDPPKPLAGMTNEELQSLLNFRREEMDHSYRAYLNRKREYLDVFHEAYERFIGERVPNPEILKG